MKLLISCFSLIMFISCAESPKDIETNTAETTVQDIDTTTKGGITVEDSIIIPGAPNIVMEKYDTKDYPTIEAEIRATENIGGIMIGDEVNDVLMLLGEPEKIEEEVIWEVDGNYHTFWTYESLGLSVEFIRSEKEKNSTVQVISLNRNSLSTSKGVSIGTHRNILLHKYINEISVEGNEISPAKIVIGDAGVTCLSFIFENDTVTNIHIGPLIRC